MQDPFGNEFCIMREGEHRFYWLGAEDVTRYELSLADARRNFARLGASDERVLPHVRAPLEAEQPR